MVAVEFQEFREFSIWSAAQARRDGQLFALCGRKRARHDHSAFIIEGNQAGVKQRVKIGRQQQSIVRIEALPIVR